MRCSNKPMVLKRISGVERRVCLLRTVENAVQHRVQALRDLSRGLSVLLSRGGLGRTGRAVLVRTTCVGGVPCIGDHVAFSIVFSFVVSLGPGKEMLSHLFSAVCIFIVVLATAGAI